MCNSNQLVLTISNLNNVCNYGGNIGHKYDISDYFVSSSNHQKPNYKFLTFDLLDSLD